MLDKAKTVLDASAVDDWLAGFERALASVDDRALGELFHADSHWRDVLALTWRIETTDGRNAIVRSLGAAAAHAHPARFRLAAERTPPRPVTRVDRNAVEAIFSFETSQGRGSGVVRLTVNAEDDDAAPKAWTLLTTLDEIKGHEEQPGRLKSQAKVYSRDFRGPNWRDLREAAIRYSDRDPEVLVVGAGQAGLSIAARLGQLELDTLVVDRHARVGDNWRNRYHALVLHNQTHVNHMPYMPFPASWPAYIPKDKLAGWFRAYAESLELNVWAGTEFLRGARDERAGRWSVTLRMADGSTREMNPRHVVMATGASGVPVLPEIPTLGNFAGQVLHASRYEDGEAWKDKHAIVIGSGNSGHDIAQDLHSAGAKVTMVQRSPTMIVNVAPSAQLQYALYDEGPPLEDCDLVAISMPLSLVRESHKRLTEQARIMDRELLDGLERRGFKLDFGEDGTGWQFKYLTRGGGYYFNVGCSDLIVNGEIGLVQYSDIAGFVADGARLLNGATVRADLIVLATGYKGQDHLVRQLFGAEVADRVGPIWGFGDGQELRNMFVRTAQQGLWFIAGSFAQCRIYSKYLALQIKADELGLGQVSD